MLFSDNINIGNKRFMGREMLYNYYLLRVFMHTGKGVYS